MRADEHAPRIQRRPHPSGDGHDGQRARARCSRRRSDRRGGRRRCGRSSIDSSRCSRPSARTSEISRINRGELHLLDASPEVIEVVDACTWLEHASDGAFRARRPGDAIDRSGGFREGLGRRAGREVPRSGRTCGTGTCPSAATSRRVAPPATDRRGGSRSPIRTATIRAPFGRSSRSTAMPWRRRAPRRGVVICGMARTDQPAEALASMTVVGPHLTWADAFATTAFVMGRDGIDWVARFDGYRALAITDEARTRPTRRPVGSSGIDGVSA